jgi:hypothetical protein
MPPILDGAISLPPGAVESHKIRCPTGLYRATLPKCEEVRSIGVGVPGALPWPPALLHVAWLHMSREVDVLAATSSGFSTQLLPS